MIVESRTELINGVGEFGMPPGGSRESLIKIGNTFRQVRAVDLEGNRHLGKRLVVNTLLPAEVRRM